MCRNFLKSLDCILSLKRFNVPKSVSVGRLYQGPTTLWAKRYLLIVTGLRLNTKNLDYHIRCFLPNDIHSQWLLVWPLWLWKLWLSVHPQIQVAVVRHPISLLYLVTCNMTSNLHNCMAYSGHFIVFLKFATSPHSTCFWTVRLFLDVFFSYRLHRNRLAAGLCAPPDRLA